MSGQVSDRAVYKTQGYATNAATRGENPEKDFHSFLLQLHCLQTMETKNKIIGTEVQQSCILFLWAVDHLQSLLQTVVAVWPNQLGNFTAVLNLNRSPIPTLR